MLRFHDSPVSSDKTQPSQVAAFATINPLAFIDLPFIPVLRFQSNRFDLSISVGSSYPKNTSAWR
jgi:hypothetical protein